MKFMTDKLQIMKKRGLKEKIILFKGNINKRILNIHTERGFIVHEKIFNS